MKIYNNFSYIHKCARFLVLLPFLVSCAHLVSKPLVSLDKSSTAKLELKGQEGRKEDFNYYSSSIINSYEEGQLVKVHEDLVEFKVESTYGKFDSKEGLVRLKSKTTAKDGLVDLHDMAFPEKGETIEFIYSKTGDVIKAGDFPKSSVFYIPPIPLPAGSIHIGDTWELRKLWVGMKNGVPLEIQVVAILKNVYACGEEQCADIELSGNVGIVGQQQIGMRFNSEIWGRILFAIQRGTVFWSEIQSREDMVLPDSNSVVYSCLAGQLEQMDGIKWPLPKHVKCTARNGAVVNVPGL